MSSDIEELPPLALGKVSFNCSTAKNHKITFKSGNKNAHIHRSCPFSYVIPSSYLLGPRLYIQYRNITDHNNHSPSPKTHQSTTGSTQVTMAKMNQICSLSLFTGTGYCSDIPLSLHLLLASLLACLIRRAGTRRNNGSPRRPHDLLPRW